MKNAIIALALCGTFFAEATMAAPLSVDQDYGHDAPEIQMQSEQVIADPLEGVNRAIFGFNQTVDGLFLAPVAQLYRDVVPEWGRDRVGNALNNMLAPVHFINAVLQADGKGAFTAFWRFIINSTIGLGGTFDVAKSNAGLNPTNFSYSQTMGRYGIGSGPYLMIPVIGSSTPRDLTGMVLGSLTNPFNALNSNFVVGRNVTNVIDSREEFLDITRDIEATSFDPYATYRSAYAQRQMSVIQVEGD